jgi:hypothetical protein
MTAMRWTRSPAFVVAFVVVDVVVILLAYLAIHRESSVGADTSATPASPTTSTAPSSPIVGPLSLTAAPGGALMRATRGTCDRRDPVRARVWVASTYRVSRRCWGRP